MLRCGLLQEASYQRDLLEWERETAQWRHREEQWLMQAAVSTHVRISAAAVLVFLFVPDKQHCWQRARKAERARRRAELEEKLEELESQKHRLVKQLKQAGPFRPKLGLAKAPGAALAAPALMSDAHRGGSTTAPRAGAQL